MEPEERASLLPGLVIAAVLLLLWSLVLPANAAPEFQGGWKDISDPGGLSFLSALFTGGLVAIMFLAGRSPSRTILLALAGILLLAFGVYHLHEDLLRLAYRNHPALHHIVMGGAAYLTLPLLTLLLPAGLVGHAARPTAITPRILVVLGLVAALVTFLLISAPGGERAPLAALLEIQRAPDTLQGDRIAGWLVLGTLVLLPGGLFVFLSEERRAPWALLGVLFCLLVAGAVLVLAMHVAKPSHWLDALPAVKTALLLGAGLLLAPPALGEVLARIR